MRAFTAGVALLAFTAAAHGGELPKVFLHFTDGSAEARDAAMRVGLLLEDQGIDVVDIRPVPVVMSAPTIRYFVGGQRAEAERLAQRLGPLLQEQGAGAAPIRIQDFTSYSPKPRGRAMEVWLARQAEPPPKARVFR